MTDATYNVLHANTDEQNLHEEAVPVIRANEVTEETEIIEDDDFDDEGDYNYQ